MTDPKKESEKSAVSNQHENKLSDEELSRLNRRAEIDNLANTNLSNREKYNSKENLRETKQVVVERRHGGYVWFGGGTILLLVILVIILV